jgi:hypothetical protein
MEYSEEYIELENILKGKPTSKWINDDIEVRFNEKNPGKSLVKLHFNSVDKFTDLFDGSLDYSDKGMVEKLFSYYSSTEEFMDSYTAEGDFKSGWVLDYFNDENKVKLNEIIESDFKFGNREKTNKEISEFLLEHYGDQSDQLTHEYAQYYNECLSDSMRELIEKELNGVLFDLNLIPKYNFNEYVTTAKNLFNLYNKVEQNKTLSIYGLIENLIYDKSPGIGNYWDDVWNHGCNNFNKEDFNYYVSRELDEIIEKIESSYNDNPNFHEYKTMYYIVNKLGGFDKWIPLQKENRFIKFVNFNGETNTLVFYITKKGGTDNPEYDGSLDSISEKRSVNNVEDLNNEIYHPELFESIKKHLRKFLI